MEMNTFKIEKFKDLLEFTNEYIDNKTLKKYKFTDSDIDYIITKHELDLLKHNNKVLLKLLKTKNQKVKVTVNEFKHFYKLENDYKKYNNKIIVSKTQVKELLTLIKQCSKIGKVKYKQLAELLIKKNNIEDVSTESFNGGNNRKHYFKYYYHPLKVLENLGKIKQKKDIIILL